MLNSSDFLLKPIT